MKITPDAQSKEKPGVQNDVTAADVNLLNNYVPKLPMLDRTVTDDCARGRKSNLGTYVDIYIE
jgi:hypothetical protein